MSPCGLLVLGDSCLVITSLTTQMRTMVGVLWVLFRASIRSVLRDKEEPVALGYQEATGYLLVPGACPKDMDLGPLCPLALSQRPYMHGKWGSFTHRQWMES